MSLLTSSCQEYDCFQTGYLGSVLFHRALAVFVKQPGTWWWGSNFSRTGKAARLRNDRKSFPHSIMSIGVMSKRGGHACCGAKRENTTQDGFPSAGITSM
jgi:hypothetical protein